MPGCCTNSDERTRNADDGNTSHFDLEGPQRRSMVFKRGWYIRAVRLQRSKSRLEIHILDRTRLSSRVLLTVASGIARSVQQSLDTDPADHSSGYHGHAPLVWFAIFDDWGHVVILVLQTDWSHDH